MVGDKPINHRGRLNNLIIFPGDHQVQGVATLVGRVNDVVLGQAMPANPKIGHFTVMEGSEAESDLVLIQTFFALLWKLFLKNTSEH